MHLCCARFALLHLSSLSLHPFLQLPKDFLFLPIWQSIQQTYTALQHYKRILLPSKHHIRHSTVGEAGAEGQVYDRDRLPTIKKVLLGVVQHVGVLEAGELALEPAQVAFSSASCNVFCLLADALLLWKCDILNALQCPVSGKRLALDG